MLLVGDTYLNATAGHMIGESEPYEPWTEDTGKLFRTMQREYGRCVSSVYIDTPDGAVKCGWVFQGRDFYEDTREPYIREVWITLYDRYERVVQLDATYHAL